MIDINKLVEFENNFIDLSKKHITYNVIIEVFKSKAKKALDDGNANEASVYIDILGFCVDKQTELLHELENMNEKIANL